MKYFISILALSMMTSVTACTTKGGTPTQPPVTVVDAAHTEKLIVMQPVVVTPDTDASYSGGVENLPVESPVSTVATVTPAAPLSGSLTGSMPPVVPVSTAPVSVAPSAEAK